jgi:hypothetical protein
MAFSWSFRLSARTELSWAIARQYPTTPVVFSDFRAVFATNALLPPFTSEVLKEL